MYLLHLGVIKTLSAFTDNIYFALNINIGFIFVGFFVYIAYIFLIIATIELAGAALRKWTYYAAVAFTAIWALSIVNVVSVIEYTPKVLAFLINEPSLVLFFIKATALWLILTVTALIINRFTIYHKSQNKAAKKGVVIICVLVAAMILIVGTGVIMFTVTPAVRGSSMVEDVTHLVESRYVGLDEIRIDVSHLPKDSGINIKGTNIAIPSETGEVAYNSTDAVVDRAEMLNNLQGDTIVILLVPPSLRVNGIEISSYANPRLTAYLDGNTLFLDYNLDEANAVIMPIWGIVRQFDCYKDKGILSTHLFGYSSGGNTSARIIINVE